ncbi:MAG: hypothetical protein WAK67_13900, partial [Xanthobacteraceae bacterium]
MGVFQLPKRCPASVPVGKGPLDFRHPHLDFNRVGNETILMGGMMHLIELFRIVHVPSAFCERRSTNSFMILF